MARHGKQRRAKQKRQAREHAEWAQEQTQEGSDKRAGEFVVLLWPDMQKTQPMNWSQAESLWRSHTDRAMIFAKDDFTCKKREPN
jgi:hypothetical protein